MRATGGQKLSLDVGVPGHGQCPTRLLKSLATNITSVADIGSQPRNPDVKVLMRALICSLNVGRSDFGSKYTTL
jgi:hypothetical protein